MVMSSALKSTYRGVSDGTLQVIDLFFEVFPEDSLRVYLDGEEQTTGFTFDRNTTPQRVTFDAPIPDGVNVIIRRNSDLSELPHVFHYTGNIKGGAEFNSKNMDENFAKILRASEDAMDSFELVGINVEAALDADAAAQRAEAAADAAESSYQNTLAYDLQAKQYRDEAQSAASSASNSRDLAYAWANNPEDQAVENNEYSAYHWAKKAETSAGGGIHTEDSSSVEFTGDGTFESPLSAEVTGLGTAAERDVGTSSGNVMEVGAFGLGLVSRDYRTVDQEGLDNLAHSGFFYVNRSNNNLPGHATVIPLSANGDKTWNPQLAVHTSGTRTEMYLRSSDGQGVYHDWQVIHHTGNILKATGNNDNYPMSQKAVTDALNTKANLNQPGTMGLGVGQTWQDVSSTRHVNTVYTNTSGRAISVSVGGAKSSSQATAIHLSVNGTIVNGINISSFDVGRTVSVTAIVPAGSSYEFYVTGDVSLSFWRELR